MYEYKLIKLNNSALPKLGKEGRELVSVYNETMYFKKAIKQTRNITIDKISPEWTEFITEYRKINNNGSYAKTLIKKYHELKKEYGNLKKFLIEWNENNIFNPRDGELFIKYNLGNEKPNI